MFSIAQRGARAAFRRPVKSHFSVAALTALVSAWRERARSRRLLTMLDAHALRDIGIDPTRAELEANVPFWRLR